jgi:DNA/RNA endonuclease YhcR with UshA esterase domain
MKLVAILVFSLTLLSRTAVAQATSSTNNAPSNTDTNVPVNIPAAEAKKHLKADAVVTGTIAEVHLGAGAVHLNFEQPYPNAVFTAVIFANKTNLFPEVAKLKGKTVEVSGKITEYQGRPEIVLASTNQLKIVEKVVAPDAAEKK